MAIPIVNFISRTQVNATSQSSDQKDSGNNYFGTKREKRPTKSNHVPIKLNDKEQQNLELTSTDLVSQVVDTTTVVSLLKKVVKPSIKMQTRAAKKIANLANSSPSKKSINKAY